jgi:hypothetical protein
MKNRALYKTRLSAVAVIPVSGTQMLFTTTSVPQRMIRSDRVILSVYICCFSDSEQRENNQGNVIKHARISHGMKKCCNRACYPETLEAIVSKWLGPRIWKDTGDYR